MKKSLILLPLAAAVLSGCMLLPGKKTSSGSTTATQPTSSSSSITPTEVDPSEFGTAESPIGMKAFHDLLDKLDPNHDCTTYTDQPVYLKATISSHDVWTKYDEVQYLNLRDDNLDATSMFTLVDSSVTEDFTTKDAQKGKQVLVMGYPAFYFKSKTSSYVYELLKKDNDNKPTILKVY